MYTVAFTPRAQAAINRMAARWKTKARHPEVFLQDVRATTARLATSPTIGVVAGRTERRTIYRVSTDKTKLHFYYRIDGATVVVLQVWSQYRSAPPKL